MMSLLSNDKKCYICGATYSLHRHHIFFGSANRKLSEQDGCWVYLCPAHHNGSNCSPHYNRKIDLWLKEECQIAWEGVYGTRQDFIKRYGRNYCCEERELYSGTRLDAE